MLAIWKESYDKLRQHIKKQRHYFPNKDPYSQSYFFFPGNHVQRWKLDHKEGWVLKNWLFWTVMLEKTLESPFDSKEIKPFNPKGNQPWIFIGRTVAKAEAPILWPSDAKSRLIGKDPDAGKDWRQEKETTEDEMIRWPHQFNGHEFEQALRDREGQGYQACCSPWTCKGSDMTEQLNNCITEYLYTDGKWFTRVEQLMIQKRGYIWNREILEKVREWDPAELLDLDQQIDIHPWWKVRQGTWGLTQEGQ